jgi:hypothetical protein
MRYLFALAALSLSLDLIAQTSADVLTCKVTDKASGTTSVLQLTLQQAQANQSVSIKLSNGNSVALSLVIDQASAQADGTIVYIFTSTISELSSNGTPISSGSLTTTTQKGGVVSSPGYSDPDMLVACDPVNL